MNNTIVGGPFYTTVDESGVLFVPRYFRDVTPVPAVIHRDSIDRNVIYITPEENYHGDSGRGWSIEDWNRFVMLPRGAFPFPSEVVVVGDLDRIMIAPKEFYDEIYPELDSSEWEQLYSVFLKYQDGLGIDRTLLAASTDEKLAPFFRQMEKGKRHHNP